VIDAASGKVTRPAYASGDAVVTLTARISKGSAELSHQYEVTVLKLEKTDGGGTVLPVYPMAQTGWLMDPTMGGTITDGGVSIRFPAGASATAFRVFIERLSESGVHNLPAAERLVSRVYDITKSAAGNFIRPVTITLPFEIKGIQQATHTVAVYWLNESIGEWILLDNSFVDWESGTVSGETNHFTKFAVLTLPAMQPTEEPKPWPEFRDIAGHWAEASIRAMISQGYVQGYPDGAFRPNAWVTRAEFVQLLVRAFGLDRSDEAGRVYADTASHWAHDAISAASATGIVLGYDDGTFRPDALITREQMSVMLMRALKLSLLAAGAAQVGSGISFTDRADIAVWSLPSVMAAAEQGLLTGYPDGTFRPHDYATRAETLELLRRAVDLQRAE